MKNGNTLSRNILDLMIKLGKKHLLTALREDLNKSARGKGAFKKMFEVFYDLVLEKRPVERVDDEEIMNAVGELTDSFDDLKQDFYLRIIDFVTRTVEIKEDDWYKKCLKILKDVDALWQLGFSEHAELRFLQIHQVFKKDIDGQDRKREHNYVLSKIYYYAQLFHFYGAHSKQDQAHKEFIGREDMQLIDDLEKWPVFYHSDRRTDPNTKQWNLEQASMRFYFVLFTMSKQRKDSQEALTFLREVMGNYNSKMFRLSYNRSEGSKMLNSFLTLDNKEVPTELNYAINFYLKAEEFFLHLNHNDEWSANVALNQLYADMNKALKYSRTPMVGLIYYLQTHLEKMRYSFIRNFKEFEKLADDLSENVLFTKKEIESLPARMELNQLVYDYVTGSGEVDYDTLVADTDAIEKRTRGIASINYELELLKLFARIDNSKPGMDIDQRVDAINYEAKRLNKKHDKFMDHFLSEVQDIEHTNRQKQRAGMAELHKELSKISEARNPLHNLILFWMGQFV